MTLNKAQVLPWLTSRVGKITYSTTGSRNGSDGTADCSGSVSQALIDAGGTNNGLLSTVTLGAHLKSLGYEQVYSGATSGATNTATDDIILMSATSDMAGSGGAGGHTGLISGSNFVSCTATRWSDGAQFVKDEAIQSAPWSEYIKVTRLQAHTEIWRYPTVTTTATKSSTSQLAVDGIDGVQTWKAVQIYLNKIGYKLAVDGIPGTATISALQRALNAKLGTKLVIDGIAGKATWSALQKLLGTPVDGVKSNPSQMIMALQKDLNSGKQWI